MQEGGICCTFFCCGWRLAVLGAGNRLAHWEHVRGQFRPQRKQCPPPYSLHLPPPGLNQRCISGFVTVTPLVSFVESGCCLIMSSWHLTRNWLCVDPGPWYLAEDCSVMSSIVRRGRIGTSWVTVGLEDELWKSPESSIFLAISDVIRDHTCSREARFIILVH